RLSRGHAAEGAPGPPLDGGRAGRPRFRSRRLPAPLSARPRLRLARRRRAAGARADAQADQRRHRAQCRLSPLARRRRGRATGRMTMRPHVNSDALWERAERVIPCGTQTLSKAPSQFVRGVYPKYLIGGRGSRVTDVDGNEYIDYPMALGAVLLGHAYP